MHLAGTLLLLIAAAASAQPRAPGRAILPAAETAQATLIGRIEGITQLDPSGYTAMVEVERVLVGTEPPGGVVLIGWEELSRGRPPRFADGQRVLLVLDTLPQGSLWQRRFPPDSKTLAVAAGGDAFLLDPEARDIDPLAAYLQLGEPGTPQARAAALVRIALESSPPLAGAALGRLTATPNLGGALNAEAMAQLMRAASDANMALPLRRQIVALVGYGRLTAAVPALETLARGGELEADALGALGEIRGGLPPEQVDRLLDRPEPALRVVGARFARGALAERRLPILVRSDPAPVVRSAAAVALAATRTAWGLDGALPALADPDPMVRSTAAQALGALGSSAVPTLESVARTRPAEARGAVTALSLAGPTGVAAVRRLADEHPDPRLRDFARLALGKGPHAH